MLKKPLLSYKTEDIKKTSKKLKINVDILGLPKYNNQVVVRRTITKASFKKTFKKIKKVVDRTQTNMYNKSCAAD